MLVRFLSLAACLTLALAALVVPGTSRAQTALTVSQYGRVATSLPWAVAFEKGWLSESGLEIEEIVSGEGGGTSVRNMLASDVPFGEVSLSAAVAAARNTDFDFVIVYGGGNHIGELSWIAMPGSGIETVEDLRGRTIGYTNPRSTTDMVIRMVLEEAGIAEDEVELISTGGLGAGLTALTQGGVDAAPVVDPFLTEHGDEFQLVFLAADHLPVFSWNVGITTREFAEEHPETVRALIAARRRAADLIYDHPEEVVEIYARVWDMDEALAATLLEKFSSMGFWSRGEFDREGLDTMLEGMLLVGDISEPVQIETLIDQSFLPEDLRTDL